MTGLDRILDACHFYEKNHEIAWDQMRLLDSDAEVVFEHSDDSEGK